MPLRVIIELDTVWLMAVGWSVHARNRDGGLEHLVYRPCKEPVTPEVALEAAMAWCSLHIRLVGQQLMLNVE